MIEFGQQSETSSIGPLWPPSHASFDRIRGFYNKGIITDQYELSDVLNNVDNIFSDVIQKGEGPSRVSIRAIIDNDILAATKDPLLEKLGEALIPLDTAGEPFKKSSILYLGANHADRVSDSTDLMRAQSNYTEAMRRSSHSAREMITRVYNQGYSLKTATPEMWNNTSSFLQLAKLYLRFGWDSADVLQLIQNPNNLITIATYNDEIVSAGIAEMLKIDLTNPNSLSKDLELRLVELTEAATHSSHQGKGLYSAVATAAILELDARSKNNGISDGKVDLVYGECNALSVGVLKAARSQSRDFSIGNSTIFPGILSQHVPILGAERSTKYNDLIPAYIGRDNMIKFAKS